MSLNLKYAKRIAYALNFDEFLIRPVYRAHIWPNLELEGSKPIPSP